MFFFTSRTSGTKSSNVLSTFVFFVCNLLLLIVGILLVLLFLFWLFMMCMVIWLWRLLFVLINVENARYIIFGLNYRFGGAFYVVVVLYMLWIENGVFVLLINMFRIFFCVLYFVFVCWILGICNFRITLFRNDVGDSSFELSSSLVFLWLIFLLFFFVFICWC